MKRLELLLLGIMKQISAHSFASAVSIYELKKYANLEQSITTLNRSIRFLLSQECIEQGVKDSKSYTYYITEKGYQILEEVK